jgi:hypothetical protein
MCVRECVCEWLCARGWVRVDVWMCGWILIQMRFIKRIRKPTTNPIIYNIMIGLFKAVTFKFKLRHALIRNILNPVQSAEHKICPVAICQNVPTGFVSATAAHNRDLQGEHKNTP